MLAQVPAPVSPCAGLRPASGPGQRRACPVGFPRVPPSCRRADAPQLAAVTGMSVTSIGHAETGRLWQSRRFWELVDKGSARAGNSWPCTTPTAPRRSLPIPLPHLGIPRPGPPPISCLQSRSPPPCPW